RGPKPLHALPRLFGLGLRPAGKQGACLGLNGRDRQAMLADEGQLFRDALIVELELADLDGVDTQPHIVLDVLLEAPGPRRKLADAKLERSRARHDAPPVGLPPRAPSGTAVARYMPRMPTRR